MTSPPTPPATSPPTPPATARRELTTAVLACAAAGGLALSSAGQAWAHATVTRQAPLPPVAADLTGSDLAPLVPATGLLLLAAAVALFAVRGWGRVALGVVVAAAGATGVVSAVRVLAGTVDVDAADLGAQVGVDRAGVSTDVVAGWPVLALVAGVLGLVGGVLVVVRGRGWPGMGRRYERGTPAGAPAATPAPTRPVAAEDRHAAAWKALDGGDDPTDDGPDQAVR